MHALDSQTTRLEYRCVEEETMIQTIQLKHKLNQIANIYIVVVVIRCFACFPFVFENRFKRKKKIHRIELNCDFFLCHRLLDFIRSLIFFSPFFLSNHFRSHASSCFYLYIPFRLFSQYKIKYFFHFCGSWFL